MGLVLPTVLITVGCLRQNTVLFLILINLFILGFPGSAVVTNLPANAEDGSIPGSGRSPGGGNGNPLQNPCLENSTDSVWWATVYLVAE